MGHSICSNQFWSHTHFSTVHALVFHYVIGYRKATSVQMSYTLIAKREEPVGVNLFTRVFPVPQVSQISNFRSLSLLPVVFISLTFVEIFSLFDSENIFRTTL